MHLEAAGIPWVIRTSDRGLRDGNHKRRQGSGIPVRVLLQWSPGGSVKAHSDVDINHTWGITQIRSGPKCEGTLQKARRKLAIHLCMSHLPH